MELVGATGLGHVHHLVLLQRIRSLEGLPADVAQVRAHLGPMDVALVPVKVDPALKRFGTLCALKAIGTGHCCIVGVAAMSQKMACEVVTVGG